MKLLWRETTTVGFAKWVDKDQMYDMCRKNLVSSEEICVSVCSSEIISPSENCREWNISNLRHGSIKWSPRCTHIICSWRIIFITYKVALSIDKLKSDKFLINTHPVSELWTHLQQHRHGSWTKPGAKRLLNFQPWPLKCSLKCRYF